MIFDMKMVIGYYDFIDVLICCLAPFQFNSLYANDVYKRHERACAL